jgi:plastocyanin
MKGKGGMRASTLSTATILVGTITAFACGGSSSPSSPSNSTSNLPTIMIVGQNGAQAFSPNPAPLGGQQVVFKNNDAVTHRVVLNSGSVDTGDIPSGATSRAVTMPTSGTNYHCSIHPGMIGAVNASSGGAPPPCEGQYCSGY